MHTDGMSFVPETAGNFTDINNRTLPQSPNIGGMSNNSPPLSRYTGTGISPKRLRVCNEDDKNSDIEFEGPTHLNSNVLT